MAQILAAATYPAQVVEADRWLQQHTGLQGAQLAQEVDQQPWDPSVKALAQFPSVLANMDKNLSWTSALGDASINQPQDVMQAIQVMRQRAQQAGNLLSTSQQQVTQQGQTIVIEPADPQVVYVPGPGIAFGVGVGVGLFAGFGWGWHHWGADWHHHTVIYNHDTCISHSRTFIHRDYYVDRARAHFDHGGEFHGMRDFHGLPQHDFAAPHGQIGPHSGAFSSDDHGSVAGDHAFHGWSRFGGDFHGGGVHEGGSHGGDRR